MSPRSRSACWGFYAVGKLAQQPYSPGICELCSWTSRYGVRSPGSACRRANASVELHSIMPRLSLLGTPAYYFAGRGYTWVKIGCKSGVNGSILGANQQCAVSSECQCGRSHITGLLDDHHMRGGRPALRWRQGRVAGGPQNPLTAGA